MNEVESFDVLETKQLTVKYAGEVLEIRPLTIGQLPSFVRNIRPVFASLAHAETVHEAGGDVVDIVMEIIADHGEGLQKAMGIAVGKPVEFIQAGQADEFLELVKAVIGINRDFFGRRLVQMLRPDAPAPQQSPGDGQTASSS